MTRRRRQRGRSVAGAVVAVTGGARGIGWATAEAFVRAGAIVAVGDVDEAALASVGQQSGVCAIRLDVTDERSFDAFIGEVEQRLGPLDILVNNAGIMPVGPISSFDAASCQRVVDINLLGVIRGSRLAADRMVRRGSGHIINVASIAGVLPAPGLSVYNASKFGVVGFSEALGAELGRQNVCVSTVLPSFTGTGLIEGISLPGSALSPDDVAAAILDVAATRAPRRSVPRASGIAGVMAAVLPGRARRNLLSTPRYARIFLAPDEAARSSYDTRIRPPSGAINARR